MRRLSEAELAATANIDPRTPGTSELVEVGHYVPGSQADAGDVLNRIKDGSLLHGMGGGSPFDVLRSAVTVQPGPGTVRRGPPRSRPAFDDAVLGNEAQEWMEDAVRGIVNSAVDLRITEQGRTAFAVLGAGEFSIAVSQDGNQVALVSGDDVLLTAERAPHFPQAGIPSYVRSDGRYGDLPGAASPGPRQNTLQEALERASEIATHPLSLLVYALAAAYAILWKVLASQGERRAANARAAARGVAPSHRRSSSRHRSRHRRRP